jgi:hypothetical protein
VFVFSLLSLSLRDGPVDVYQEAAALTVAELVGASQRAGPGPLVDLIRSHPDDTFVQVGRVEKLVSIGEESKSGGLLSTMESNSGGRWGGGGGWWWRCCCWRSMAVRG